MGELGDIIAAYRKAEQEQIRTVLATVVKVEGSSYRMPGARMLVSEYGEMTGAISGGCLEGDALRRALLALHQQSNKLVTYDTTHESDQHIGIQLGCNGIVHILFEYIDSTDPDHPIALLEKLLDQREPAIVTTVFSFDRNAQQQGTCCIQLEKETISKPHISISCANLKPLMEQVNHNKETFRTVLEHDQVKYELLLEYHLPTVHLLLIGAGNDAQPVAEMAAIIGFEVTVIDGRASHATADRFKMATQVIVSSAADVVHQVDIDHYTVAVLMSHNYDYDKTILEQLVNTPCSYIGLLGPKKRFQRILNEMQEEGLVIDTAAQAKLHGPVGLDIGAQTSAEIALAILAEIKAFLHQRSGNSLRDRTEKMHHDISTL
ncbi:XdhC family protein [Sphingobacterium faecium]|uniref:XdhC family protein n=1 Tax=Sphingobacterium faecium TaxID=34087 RepID=UPI00320937DD